MPATLQIPINSPVCAVDGLFALENPSRENSFDAHAPPLMSSPEVVCRFHLFLQQEVRIRIFKLRPSRPGCLQLVGVNPTDEREHYEREEWGSGKPKATVAGGCRRLQVGSRKTNDHTVCRSPVYIWICTSLSPLPPPPPPRGLDNRLTRSMDFVILFHFAATVSFKQIISSWIFDPVYDVKLAVKRTLWGKSLNGGQTCASPDYVLVPRAHQAAFTAALKEACAAFYPDGSMASDSISRIETPAHHARLMDLFKCTKGKVAFGGISDSEG
ncbi:hypothetical protein C8R44DRAFT_727605 [Mycena epipterygia]|nr:hypothetical protein C8R44DRAFT_727605 [Mycena epipterygia]